MHVRGAVLAVLIAGALGGVAGCGNDSGGTSAADDVASPVATVAASALPCRTVWTADHKLPDNYTGCLLDGHMIEADRHSCSSGQVLVTYRNAFYAVTGGPVQHVPNLSHSAVYKKMIRACNG